MRKWMCCLIGLANLALVLAARPALAGGCGCEAAAHCKVCKHCCRQCDSTPSRSAPQPRAVYAPRAAVVDSLPVFQMSPGVIAMPMMMTTNRQVSFEEPRARSSPDCSTSKDRIDVLEDKVEALNLRMQTIQRSVEIQTRILEEMKAERMFPQRYLPPAAEPGK
jgi:hypothetical protein